MTNVTVSARAEPSEFSPQPKLNDPTAQRGERLKQALYGIVSLSLLLGIWEIASLLIGAAVLPGPWATFVAATSGNPYIWSDMRITSIRILGAFGISLGVSLTVGVLLGSSKLAERLIGPWVTIGAAIPALVFIVVGYLAVGLTDFSAMLGAAFVVTPSMTWAIWDGMKAINPEATEMARAFRLPRWTIIRGVIVPQTLPFVFVAARTGLSLTWRIMIFVELIGRSSGVGYRIQYWYNLFNMREVLGVAAPFCVLMLLVEFAILRPLERRLFRWRRVETH